MTNNQENAQDAAKDKAQELKDKAKETAQTAKEGAQAAGDKSQETAKTASGPDESDLESTKAKAREVAETTSGKAQDVGDKAKETAKTAGEKIATDLEAVKEKVAEASPTPTPQTLKAESSAQDLKARLEWGEPALTIIDVRNRDTHNQSHILGAVPMPIDELVKRAQSSLQPNRDIYVYGESDKEASQAAKSLRDAGFVNVAELKGGLDGWKRISGATDGIAETKG